MSSRLTSCLCVLAAVLATTAPTAAADTRHRAIAANTGEPGSRCAAVGVAAPAPADAAALDTTSLGPTANARYAIGAPTRAPERDQPVKRVMMLLHGGGWYMVGQGTLDITQGKADEWRAAGWEAVNADYLPCGQSIRSALAMYDLIRAHYDPSVPVCIDGDSAGAQLALMIAAKRSGVSCVIANGAPTDLVRIGRQGVHAAFAATAPKLLATGAVATGGIAVAAFGKRGIRAASPLRQARDIHARVLLAIAKDDPLIPVAQTAGMERALRTADPSGYVDADVLDPGSETFVHGTASKDELAEYDGRVAALVAPFGDAPVPEQAASAKPSGNIISNLLDQLLGGFKKRK